VPGVDLSGAGDVRRIRKEFLKLGNQGAIGAVFKTGRQDSRQLEVLGNVGEGQHIVLELTRREVLQQGNKPGLMVHKQDYGIVLGKTLVVVLAGHGSLPADTVDRPHGPVWTNAAYGEFCGE